MVGGLVEITTKDPTMRIAKTKVASVGEVRLQLLLSIEPGPFPLNDFVLSV